MPREVETTNPKSEKMGGGGWGKRRDEGSQTTGRWDEQGKRLSQTTEMLNTHVRGGKSLPKPGLERNDLAHPLPAKRKCDEGQKTKCERGGKGK